MNLELQASHLRCSVYQILRSRPKTGLKFWTEPTNPVQFTKSWDQDLKQLAVETKRGDFTVQFTKSWDQDLKLTAQTLHTALNVVQFTKSWDQDLKLDIELRANIISGSSVYQILRSRPKTLRLVPWSAQQSVQFTKSWDQDLKLPSCIGLGQYIAFSLPNLEIKT